MEDGRAGLHLRPSRMGNALSGSSHRLPGAGELVLDSQLQYECRWVVWLM